MVVATVKYVNPSPIHDQHGERLKHWSKVEGPFQSFGLLDRQRVIEDITGREKEFKIDECGFAVHMWPVQREAFADEGAIRSLYYPEVEQMLRSTLSGHIYKVIIFDHTLRQMKPESVRKPVMQVHVDQTAKAAEARVRRHAPDVETNLLLQKRYALLNVWRPIGVPAIEYPLSLVDWRTTQPQDYVEVDLLYPQRNCGPTHRDSRGLEEIPAEATLQSISGYEVNGETYGIAPNEEHRFYYAKNLSPDMAIVFKCFDSDGPEGGLPNGTSQTASFCPHTAFVDPETPADAPSRRSVEVRCLVFWD